MAERKFSKAVGKPGMAAHVREAVSQVVKESSNQIKSKQVEPIDYEDFFNKHKTIIQNDPLRELLLYPTDDVTQVVLPRRYRTTTHNIPLPSETNECNLLVKASLKSYSSNWNLIHYKYSAYSGTYLDLPKLPKVEELKEEIYEVDTDLDQLDEQNSKLLDGITKEGFLLKGPDVVSDRMFGHLGSKSFKRRYCYLRRQVDGCYILELFKDDRKGEAKPSIDMEFVLDVCKNPKRGKNCFELKGTGHKSYTFATESDIELDDWVNKLQQVIQQIRSQEETRTRSLERGASDSTPPPQLYGTLKGLDQSVNPQLNKYGRETDSSIALARKESRKRLFNVYPHMPHVKTSLELSKEPSSEPYREQMGTRIFVQCCGLQFRLQAPADEETEASGQVEPYFCSLALFDVKEGRKLTENFYFDLNDERSRQLVQNGLSPASISKILSSELSQVPDDWALYPKRAAFSVTSPHPDIFLVLRIDKVLQGSIASAADAYVRCAKDPKLGGRVHKSVKMCCQRLGKYRMPFAWTARPLFRLYSNELDTTSEFPAIYRQEPNRLKDEEILKILSEYRKPDKMNKLSTIPGRAKIQLESITELPENSLTTALVPLKPFPIPPKQSPTLEVAEFESSSQHQVHPYTTFNNHLYVYPRSLSFDTQKTFSRARNIACVIELRDSDEENATPLHCIYGRPGSPLLTQRIICSVIHHNTTPVWGDEVKLRLPIQLKAKHHLLFTFYHVSCELTKKKETVETCVGYAWLPLMQKGRLVVEDYSLAVASHLPPGYLAIQPFGLDKGNSPPEVTWVDGQRQIFSVGFQLVSTVATRDKHLHNLFSHLDRMFDEASLIPPCETETCKILKASHAIHLNTVLTFFPTILNQLFKLLLVSKSEEVGINTVRLLIHLIHQVHESDREDVLHSYVKFVFVTPSLPAVKSSPTTPLSTVHEELTRRLTTMLSTPGPDFLIINKFMQHSSFFFHIMSKSMAQHLLSTGRIKMHRNERFSTEFLGNIESFVDVLIPFIISKRKNMPLESQALNKSLAHFMKKLLTVMDRGYVFRLINKYFALFSGAEGKTLLELKLTFLQILTSHEHYVPFNLPVLLFRPSKSGDSPVKSLGLTDEFRKHHYLVGLLLEEAKSSLADVASIRKQALGILRDLMAKHELDDRYQNRGQLSRIAGLYLPWLHIVLDNLHRLTSVLPLSAEIHQKRVSSYSSVSQTPRLSQNPGSRTSVCLKDSHLFAVIAGENGMTNGTSEMSLESEESGGDGLSNFSQETTIVRDSQGIPQCNRHARSVSGVAVLQPAEVRDVLLCFLFVVKYLSEESLVAWWQRLVADTPNGVLGFFSVIELSLHQFKYLGKKKILGKPGINKPQKAMTLPARMQPPDFARNDTGSSHGGTSSVGRDGQLPDNESAKLYQALLEANMATEVGLIALDTLGLYCVNFRDELLMHNGDNPLMNKVFDIYLSFLQVGQSETLFRHVFSAFRAFINNFSVVLFKGNALVCGRLCYELLRCCNSRLSTIRQEACSILYLLMRSNFEFTNRKGLNRVHLQVIISVSHMLGTASSLNTSRFQESLSLINSFATSDKVMKGTGFPGEVKDLTRRIRTVLMATAQMMDHHQDPEMLLDLQHSLANSYASTPQLRHTWLDSMARNHIKDGNYSEAMCCNLHIAALMAEYLKLKKVQDWGAESFSELSFNIAKDEIGLKLDSGVQDVQYTETSLQDQLENCVALVDKAERYELLAPLYQLIMPKYKKARNFDMLAHSYQTLATAFTKVAECNRSGKRLLGRYYRVAFYGQAFFEEEHGNEYIYKEPKVTALVEISDRLFSLYSAKFGKECVRIVKDSNQVDETQLDVKLAHIQVTSVTPYFEPEISESRQTEFEINHDVTCFMYETPFTRDGRIRADPQDQWKRRTLLWGQHALPYVTKRVRVVKRQVTELSPIQVAIDEMRSRVTELEEVVASSPTDPKKLQLRLQGAVCVQVNAGPLAYAYAFLDPSLPKIYPDDHVEALKEVFFDFAKICWGALQLNCTVIETSQQEYQRVLETNFEAMCQELTKLLGETVCPEAAILAKGASPAQFSLITGSSHTSSNA